MSTFYIPHTVDLVYDLHIYFHLKKKVGERNYYTLYVSDEETEPKEVDLFDALEVVGQGQDLNLPNSPPFLCAIETMLQLYLWYLCPTISWALALGCVPAMLRDTNALYQPWSSCLGSPRSQVAWFSSLFLHSL